MTPKRLIVFDMDGVIVDVSRSYRETVRKAARMFFTGADSWEALPEPLFSLEDLSKVKQSGGLNNDWDLTCCVIELLCMRIRHPQLPNRVDPRMDPWDRYRKDLSLCDVAELASYLKDESHPLTTLLHDFGKLDNSWVRSFYAGDVGTGNIIKQMFQEIYLGEDLFRTLYGISSVVHSGKGLILNEKPLLDSGFIKDLASDNILAIATGRPGNEAEHPLRRFKIKEYFRRIYTHDECVKAEADIYRKQGKRVSLGKPNPFMLDAIALDITEPVQQYCYIGDMPDDMIAARRSKYAYKAIGVIFSDEDKESLKEKLVRSGASQIAHNVDELKGIFNSGGSENER